jgi:hypothetical protein
MNMASVTMNLPPLLAANWDELISFGVGLVFLIVWLVNQISDAKKKAMPLPMPADQPQEAMVEPPKPAANDPLRNQVDDFLRRVNERAREIAGEPQKPAAQPASRQRPSDEIVVLLDEAPPQRLREARAPTLQPAAQQPPQQPPQRQPRRERQPKGQRGKGKSVAEHVAERVGSSTRQMREEVSHLGERVIQADKQFDVQLEQKFGHRLGSLSDSTAENARKESATPKAATPAAQIAALLASPDGIRQAIVLNEILRRPDDRW